jgi:hypothetical protein
MLTHPKRDVFEFTGGRQIEVNQLPSGLILDVLVVPGQEPLSTLGDPDFQAGTRTGARAGREIGAGALAPRRVRAAGQIAGTVVNREPQAQVIASGRAPSGNAISDSQFGLCP